MCGSTLAPRISASNGPALTALVSWAHQSPDEHDGRWPGHERPYKWEFLENGQWFEVAVEGPIIANSKEFCLQAALDGVGIAFPTDQLSAPHIAAGRLAPLLERWSAPFPGFFLCFPAQRQMAPPLRAFIDAVRSKAAAQES